MYKLKGGSYKSENSNLTVENHCTWRAVVHSDCNVTITVYLHKTQVYPIPWNKTCYVTITVVQGSTSMIYYVTPRLH